MGLVVGRVFAGEDGVAGEQAVLEGVLRGAGYAFFGAGTGGFFCVVAVGLDLFFRRHEVYLVGFRAGVAPGRRVEPGLRWNFGMPAGGTAS